MLDADLGDINSHRASNVFFGLLQCRTYIYGPEPLSFAISFESFGSPLFILDPSLFNLLSRDILSLLPYFIFLGSLPMPKRVHVNECVSMLWDSEFNIQGDSDLVAGPESLVTFCNQTFESQTALASSASRAYSWPSSFFASRAFGSTFFCAWVVNRLCSSRWQDNPWLRLLCCSWFSRRLLPLLVFAPIFTLGTLMLPQTANFSPMRNDDDLLKSI